MAKKDSALAEQIEGQIVVIRGQRVMLDSDLARLYGITTMVLNQAVRRNRDRFPKDFAYQPLASHIKKLKKLTALPVCVGFGIHNRKQVKRISEFSEGVIVGSNIIKFIEKDFSKKNFLNKLKVYLKSLKGNI